MINNYFMAKIKDKRTKSGFKYTYPNVEYKNFSKICKIYDMTKKTEVDKLQLIQSLCKIYKIKPKQKVLALYLTREDTSDNKKTSYWTLQVTEKEE